MFELGVAADSTAEGYFLTGDIPIVTASYESTGTHYNVWRNSVAGLLISEEVDEQPVLS